MTEALKPFPASPPLAWGRNITLPLYSPWGQIKHHFRWRPACRQTRMCENISTQPQRRQRSISTHAVGFIFKSCHMTPENCHEPAWFNARTNWSTNCVNYRWELSLRGSLSVHFYDRQAEAMYVVDRALKMGGRVHLLRGIVRCAVFT